MRYYSTQRPISIGTYPNRNVVSIHNFLARQWSDEINRYAWGWIDYSQPLPPIEAKSYELIGVVR